MLRAVLSVALVAALVGAGALANQQYEPCSPEDAANQEPRFDLQGCLKYATQFNRSSCIACNVVLGMWCESYDHDCMCNEQMTSPAAQQDAAEKKTGASNTASPVCKVCAEERMFVQNARAAMDIIRHDCKVCNIYREEMDVLAERAVAHLNKEVEKSAEADCGELCSLTDCIGASEDFMFGGADALQCRQNIIEKCLPMVHPHR